MPGNKGRAAGVSVLGEIPGFYKQCFFNHNQLIIRHISLFIQLGMIA